ncbi:MAG: DUF58 domain-containing protein [Haloarculaceae archaeon]
MAEESATNRWVGVDALPWALAAIGLLTREPAVFLLVGVGVVAAAYARLGEPPQPDLGISRTIATDSPDPGEEVTVEVTVVNQGDQFLPDVRLVDGVPTALRVTEGSPRFGTALAPGTSRTLVYSIRAERGSHSFDPVTVVCRSVNGAHETTTHAVETALTCRPVVKGAASPPLQRLVSPYSGQVPTDTGGSGLEFHGIREYRPGDRASRIDWVRRARTGELTTVEFRREQTATVVLLVDAREISYVREADDENGVHAVEHGVLATAELFAGLLDAGNRVGVGALGTDLVWVAPGTGESHRHRAREVLATHPTLSPSPPQSDPETFGLDTPTAEPDNRTAAQLRRLRTRLTTDVQVFFLSPLADDAAVTIARGLHAAGHPVTVVSPDVSGDSSVGERVARLDRYHRIQALGKAGVRVADWDPDGPLAVALHRVEEAWQ